jgi:hypothetical protein
MTHERDERWAYVALLVLAVGYLAYRWLSVQGARLHAIDLPRIRLGELGHSLPYVLAPLIAVVTELYRRRHARLIKEEWQARVTSEGFVRDEENVQAHVVKGGHGTFKADLRLTRAALYLFDHTGRRDPVHFTLTSPTETEKAVVDAELLNDPSAARPRVRVVTSGMTFEFASAAADGWWSDLRRSLGKSARREPAEAEPNREGEY